MSQYTESNGADIWPYRVPVGVNNLSGGTPIDVTFTVPPQLESFWDNIDAAGAELRMVDADGETKLNYALNGAFNSATRTCTLDVDGYVPPSSDAIVLLWLYWGKTGASSGATGVTIAGAKPGKVHLGKPHKDRTVLCQAATPGTTTPSAIVSKTSNETVHVWWRLPRALLSHRKELWAERPALDEVDFVAFSVEQGGLDQSALYTESETRLCEADNGDMWIRTTVTAGTSGQAYTLILTVGATDGTDDTVHDFRALLKVQDPDEQ